MTNSAQITSSALPSIPGMATLHEDQKSRRSCLAASTASWRFETLAGMRLVASRDARRSLRLSRFSGSLHSPRVLTIAGDTSRDAASNATSSAVVAMVVLLAAAAAGAWWFTRIRETSHGRVAWFAAFGSIAGCVSLTLFREGVSFGFQPVAVFAWATTGWDQLSEGDLLGSSQFLLNVALFVPAGLAWTWATGRPLRTLGGLVAFAMLIESVQGLTGVGAADITDVVANSLGAALGVSAAAIATVALLRAGVVSGTPASSRRRSLVAAGLVVVVAITLTTLIIGADRRQARIHDELEDVFADTTYDEIAAVVRPSEDEPQPLDDSARFVDGEQIFGAISVRSNGARYTDDQIEMRWPALFFGFRRCVLVTWTPTDVEFRDMSGRACTEFIG